jgi:Protein of unknown function (DUF3574)
LKRNSLLAIPILLLITFANVQTVFPHNHFIFQHSFAQTFWRTELYFGRDKNDGTEVSDEEWAKFLDVIVTPRFPVGFTVLDGKGQYRLQNGTIVKENSKVLILLYTPKTRTVSNRKIEQIRNEYKKLFRQESVMRIDLRQTVNVSF